jgi:hypothetical protein
LTILHSTLKLKRRLPLVLAALGPSVNYQLNSLRKVRGRSLSEYSWMRRKQVLLDVHILFIFHAIHQIGMDLGHSFFQWRLHPN